MSIQLIGKNGQSVTLNEVKTLTAENVQAETQAALKNGKDDVMVTLGKDAFMASGDLGKSFTPVKARVNGQEAKIRGVQLKSHEGVFFRLLDSMNLASIRVGAGTSLLGPFVAGAIERITGKTLTLSVGRIMGTSLGLGFLAGFVGLSAYQFLSGKRIDGQAMSVIDLVPSKK